MPNLYPSDEFDEWAESYDGSISIDQFPFYGYANLLARMTRLANPAQGMRVLDLGTGTGNLALGFQRQGCEVWCTDFSKAMLEQARTKLPGAHLLLHDLQEPLPIVSGLVFERIVSAYVFHHFLLEEKVAILREMGNHLAAGGRMIIGDIAFENAQSLMRMKEAEGEAWEDEFYWLADEALPALEAGGFKASFEQVSSCAGIFLLEPGWREPGRGGKRLRGNHPARR